MMELSRTEVVVNSNGNTAQVVSIDPFFEETGNVVITDTGRGVIKKIKTSQVQIEQAIEGNIKQKSIIKLEKTKAMLSEEVKENIEEPKIEEVKEEIVEEPIVEEKPIVQEVKEPVKEETVVEEDNSYQEPIRPVYGINESNAIPNRPDARLSYDNFYNSVSKNSEEKYKADFEKTEPGTLRWKTYKIGLDKINKDNALIGEVQTELANLDSQIKRLEAEKASAKARLVELESIKQKDSDVLGRAIRQVEQIEAFDKTLEENERKAAAEKARREAEEARNREEATKKRAQMYKNLPETFLLELEEEEPKKVVAFENKDILQEISVYDKLRVLEEEVEDENIFAKLRSVA